MNRTERSSLSRNLRPRVTVAGLLASAALGTMLGTATYADMYHPASPMNGGVAAQSTITSITPSVDKTTTTICWYGMEGWYTIEAQTNTTATPNPWVPLKRVAASDHSWCETVTNPDTVNNYSFRLNQANSFAGSGACSGCHGDKASPYQGTLHASAYNTLKSIGMNDPKFGCVACHTVGFAQPTGFTDITNTPSLTDVGCEDCHGPAAWHKYSDHDLIRPALSIDPKICGGCHTDDHHPTY